MENASRTPKDMVDEFFGRVWSPPNDLSAIDELMTDDYEITTAGQLIRGREKFKRWVAEFHKVLLNATVEGSLLLNFLGKWV